MRWFQGGIAEAVATSKAKNAVFVVFIEGKDDASKTTATAVDSTAVSTKLESEDFVAIKLDSESEAYRQFAQIYQLVPVPSLFFIGGNGVPLEVVAGEVNEPELLQRIGTVLEKTRRSANKEEKPPVQAISQPSSASHSSNVIEPEKPAEVASGEASSSKEQTDEAESLIDTQTPEASSSAVDKDDKIERTKELLEIKRKMKQAEEEQAQRLKEIERRKTGQDVQKLKRWQQDQELKQLKEERQREKAEEAAARERVLKQIAQDKAERAARFSMEKDQSKKPSDSDVASPVRQGSAERSTSNIARIQFRLPDGSAHSSNFQPSTTLGEVRTYAATQLNLPFREFVMSTSFPRREFTAVDDSQTLRDLHLTPTAVILILPVNSGAVVSSGTEGYVTVVSRMMWSLLTPFFTILNYLRNMLFGGGAWSGTGSNSGHSNPEVPERTQSNTGAKRRKPNTETSTIHRQGNIHRLTNHRDSSDDENNTWNGNSTQQM